MRITLHGAAGEVTGSADLVEADRGCTLVNFGMFQGGTRPDAKNVVPSGLNPCGLNCMMVTHAHLDQIGRLPLLRKAGFKGVIHATGATIDLANIVLRDLANVQACDAEHVNRPRQRAGEPLLEAPYNASQGSPTGAEH